MNNIIKIYNRLINVYVKQRFLLICLVVQNTILSLIILIFANNIISNGKSSGELDYFMIQNFYTLAIFSLFFIICFYAPILLSNTLNGLHKKNIIEHFLSVKISISEIVYAVYFRGLYTLIILLISALPIVSISFYFGGFGLIKLLKLLVILICFAIFSSTLCLFISTTIFDVNASIIVAYIFTSIFGILHLISLNVLLNSRIILVIYVIFDIILSLILLSISSKTKIFSA